MSVLTDLVGEKHLDLELRELLPEGEVRGPLRDELVRVELPLQRLLVLVVLGVPERSEFENIVGIGYCDYLGTWPK